MTEIEQREINVFVVVASIFVGSLIISSVLAAKIITIFGIVVPAGVFGYCITFVCTDVIGEIWGKQKANQVVLGGFIALLFSFLLIKIALVWPPAPFWHHNTEFKNILGMTPRIIIGSLCAYVVSQFHDVWAYHYIREKTEGRHLWLRNNVSTMLSQLLDSTIFITIAFYGIMPVGPLILGQWCVKIVIAALDTIVVYGAVKFITSYISGSPCRVKEKI